MPTRESARAGAAREAHAALAPFGGGARRLAELADWIVLRERIDAPMPMYPLLDTIDESRRRCARSIARSCRELARELRAFLLDSVAQTGGHLSSNLGTVELTIALHYVFDTPHDRIVWDVGHQTYAHKILTGRRDGDGRAAACAGGPSGFPRRERERVRHVRHRAFVDVDLRGARAWRSPRSCNGETRRVVAVIGDGAMSAGMAFEALNNAGVAGADLLVILNDNDMSISRAGRRAQPAISRRLLSARFYNTVRRGGKEVLSQAAAGAASSRKRAEEHMKGMVLPGTLFEEFGFNYIGPIDGHDVDALVDDARQRARAEGAAVPARRHAARATATRAPRTIRSSITA